MMKRVIPIWLGLALVFTSLAQPRVHAQPRRPLHDARPALERIRRDHGSVTARLDNSEGTPTYVHGQLARVANDDALQSARAFFRRYGDAWGLDQPDQSLRLTAQERDRLGDLNLRFEQLADGLPVFGTDIRLHIDRQGVLDTVNGRLLPRVQPPATHPRLTAQAALARARRVVAGESQKPPRLGVARIDSRDHLAWELWLFDSQQPARWHLLIDALDGRVLRRQNVLHEARERHTYTSAQTLLVPGTLARTEGQPPVADVDVNIAHDYAGVVYDYYRTMFGRDSIDGAGMPIISSVHYGQKINNAYWNGSQMIYGDGDGITFAPLNRALDVVAHELTHGITQYSAHLDYVGQSGALNESFSDIFGALIDTANWEIAEAVYTPAIPGDSLRSLADPTRTGDPSVWGEYLRTAWDSGGVHSNSGIFNHVAYEIGSTIGRPKTAHIFYRTLTQKLTYDTDLVTARDLTIQACTELIRTVGVTDQDCEDVRTAFVRSGIGVPSQRATASTLPYRATLPLVLQSATNLAPRLKVPMPPACNTELIRNGSFESGLTGWVTDAEIGTVSNNYPTRHGQRSAQLNANYQLLQWVLLPADAQTATLRFHVNRVPSLASPEQPTLYVKVETTDGVTHTMPSTITGASAQDAWLDFSATLDVRDLRDLRLVFEDRYGAHYIDNVSLVAQCGA